MKVVLDNNVFISGIFWRGAPHQLIKLAEEKRIKIFTSPKILDELFDVLQREKFKHLFQEGKTNIKEVSKKILKMVKTCYSEIEVKIIKDDPTDNIFLACALSAKVDFIISGDKHLLTLKSFQNIQILSPKEFLRQFNQLKK